MQLEDIEVSGADYIKPLVVGNFRGAWEELPPETEREDDYGLGPRDNLQVCGRRGWVGGPGGHKLAA
jgi:coatomer protein complex subunit gamma